MYNRDHESAKPTEHSTAVLVVDTKGFSKHDDDSQGSMQVFVVDVLHRAFIKSNLERYWSGCRFQDGTGDGYMIGFDPIALPLVVDRLFDALHEALTEEARAGGHDMRMRLALHVGPVQDATDLRLNSPVGKTMIDTHRLVDSPTARDLLERSDPAVTRLGVIVTGTVLDWTLRRARRGWHRESEYVAVEVSLPDKEFATTAYVHVPAPSGDLLCHGLLGAPEERREEPVTPRELEPAAVSQRVDGQQAKALGTAAGDVRDESVSVGELSGSAGAVGQFRNAGDVAGRDLNRDSVVNNAKRDIVQPGGDVNNGDHSGRRGATWTDDSGWSE
ncbi:MAG TPA: hypothetical protein VE172_02540 [Stackebrandtia sp.]|jgi:hypothetical protein|uniref:hypothetical protein n=1 Tax=Stackebrandtia sp. TaxID=2023065 RepID=UPI002D4AFD1F|nr:hypothetical protein [Stackebrandtia sp.]HZE37666.1 hypothetical protein [Stackebrandtia sp.]